MLRLYIMYLNLIMQLKSKKVQTHFLQLYMVWFILNLGFNFIVLCSSSLPYIYHTPKQGNIKFKPRLKAKIEPQHKQQSYNQKIHLKIPQMPLNVQEVICTHLNLATIKLKMFTNKSSLYNFLSLTVTINVSTRKTNLNQIST